ncbi:phosphatase PAP2 family protein [Phenylobacterium aquaticum]|uniref:acid phosphatase n=1 Tax=Phenylobacterium aquaticum TaxID=1763816 RepID=UPI0026EF6694|nr:phosphatase PAP2 family protein [Phenylobacterium aquaticum]
MIRLSKPFTTTVAVAALTLALGACSALRPVMGVLRPAHARTPVDATAYGASKLRGYLGPDAIDGKTLLGPPPAPDSLRGQADRQAYEQTRALQGSPRWSAAIRDNDIWAGGALERYSCAAGRQISSQATPAVWKLLHRMELDVRTVGTPAKDFYNRSRPMIGDDRPICIPREGWMKTNASYPSGHAMVGWSWALVLAEMAPANTDALLGAGKAIGDSRWICGVHYQSDVEAGRVLGAAMLAREHAEPQFLADFAKAKAELAKAPSRTAACPAD